jgi:hypothetical protein
MSLADISAEIERLDREIDALLFGPCGPGRKAYTAEVGHEIEALFARKEKAEAAYWAASRRGER